MAEVITEWQFSELALCPLRRSEEPVFLTAAASALKQSMLDRFDGRVMSLPALRRAVEKASRASTLVPRIARRLHELSLDYEVLHPATAYDLQFGRNRVHGEYVTVARAGKQDRPLIVCLQEGISQATAQRRGVDITGLCRWLHFRTWEAALPRVRVLYWAIDRNESWMEFYEEPVVRSYLDALSQVYNRKLLYPSAGEHCDSCLQPGCFAAREEYPSRWTK